MKKRLSCFYVLFLAILIVFPPGCKDDVSGGSGRHPAGDADIEYEKADRIDWSRWEQEPFTNDKVNDTPYLQWRARKWEADPNVDTPDDVRAIIPWPHGGAVIGAVNGLFRYKPDSGEIVRIPTPDFTDFDVLDLVKGYDNQIYIIAFPNPNPDFVTLFSIRITPSSDPWVEAKTGCDMGSFPTSITSYGPSESIYIGTSGGVYEFNGVECRFKGQDEPRYAGSVLDIEGTTAPENNRIAIIKRGSHENTVVVGMSGQWSDYDNENGLWGPRPKSVDIFQNSEDRNEMWFSFETGLQYLDRRRNLIAFDALPCAASGDAPCGLPYENLRKVAVSDDGVVWLATEKGAFRHDPSDGSGRFKAFHSSRWLNSDNVTAVGFDHEGGVWIGHGEGQGITRLWREEWTLKQKADLFMSRLEETHIRTVERATDGKVRRGFIAGCAYTNSGDPESDCVTEWNEDDALWTGIYALTEMFRAKLAKDPGEKAAAEKNAGDAVELMLDLERTTPVAGMLARTLVERETEPEDWNRSSDYGWLDGAGMRSLAGHLLIYGFYYDLFTDESMRAAVSGAIGKIAQHIVDQGFRLVDLEGNPTDDGLWNDARVTNTGTRTGDAGVRALQLLALLRSAYHVTEDEAFYEAYLERANEAGYAGVARDQKTIDASRESDHALDLLAFLSYLPLLKYADITHFRGIYMESLEQAIEFERPEKVPLFTIIHGAFKHNDFGLDEAVRQLQELPVETINWKLDTCWRGDVQTVSPVTEGGLMELTEVLPVDERKIIRLDGNPYECQWDPDPQKIGPDIEETGLNFLLPYWMLRFYRMLEAPFEP